MTFGTMDWMRSEVLNRIYNYNTHTNIKPSIFRSMSSPPRTAAASALLITSTAFVIATTGYTINKNNNHNNNDKSITNEGDYNSSIIGDSIRNMSGLLEDYYRRLTAKRGNSRLSFYHSFNILSFQS